MTIVGMTLGGSDMTLTGKEFKQKYHSPVVYIWKRGNEYLYIGKCYTGFHRVVYDKLHDVFKSKNIQDDDTIEIQYFNTRSECLQTEQELIKIHDPLYNFKPGRKVGNEPYKDDVLHEIIPNHQTLEQRRAAKIWKEIEEVQNRRKK